jgi:hypothetical protein
MGEYVVRRFKDGDETAIVRLFNEVYEKFGGFLPRTVEYWRWCCLRRPDVVNDGIFLVCDHEMEKVYGYAVAGLNGNVWEFCASGDKERVASILLKEVVKYLEATDVSSVNINVPDDEVFNRAFVQEGFARVPPERMFVSALSPRELLSAMVTGKKVQFDEEIAFEFLNAPLGVEKVISVKIHDGQITVIGGSSQSATIVVRSAFTSFFSMLFGVSSLYWPFLVGKIRVSPFWKIGKVMSFVNAARLHVSWFWPMSDFG